MVVENAAEIFGEDAIYLDIKKLIKNALGEGTIPDGFIFYPEQRRFVLVEVELSSHPVYEHISKQVNKFISAFSNYKSRQKLASVLKDYIEDNPLLLKRIRPLLGMKGLYEFLEFEVFEPLAESKAFEIFVIIEDKTPQVCEALSWLKPDPQLFEVAIYAREGAEREFALRFEPQYEIKPPVPEPTKKELNWFQKCVQEKILQGCTMTEAGKMCKKKKGTTGKLDEGSFLALADENGKRVFERIFSFAKEKGYLIRWGKTGFSLNAVDGKKHVALCLGYNPDSVFRESIYTGLDFFSDNLKNADKLIEFFTNRLMELGFFQIVSKKPSKIYNVINLKWRIDNKYKVEYIERFLEIIEDVENKIEWK
jgi:hypothetical protein